ncbi:uncharacterized [Tachysurus ichikawai]
MPPPRPVLCGELEYKQPCAKSSDVAVRPFVATFSGTAGTSQLPNASHISTGARLKVPAQIQAPTSRFNLVIIPPRFPCLLPHLHRLATKGSHRRQDGISSSSGGGGKYEPFSSFLKKDSTEALIDKSWEQSYTSKEEAC